MWGCRFLEVVGDQLAAYGAVQNFKRKRGGLECPVPIVLSDALFD